MAYSLPLYRSLSAFAASALVGALATDVAYWRTADFLWVDMSDWLVSLAAIVGFVALIFAVFETIAMPRAFRPSLAYGLLSLVAWALSVLNAFVHTRDGWTSVVPLGVALSALTVVVLAFAGRALHVRSQSYAAAEFPA
jgi:uncharacterized membrane protein